MSDLHHILNHFTIALINLGILFELLGFSIKRDGMRSFGWTALRLSVGFVALSIVTGLLTENGVHVMVEQAKPVNAYHKIAAFITALLLIASVAMRALTRERMSDQLRGAALRGAYFTLLIVTFVLSAATSYLGMELTYSYGVNVEPYERILESLPPKVEHPTIEQPSVQQPGMAPAQPIISDTTTP